MTFIRFFLLLTCITLIQLGVINLLSNWLPVADCSKAVLFLGIITAAIFPIGKFGIGTKDGYTFITTAYIAIGLRFLLSLTYIVYYKLTHTIYPVGFIFCFFASYIFYTIFEITSLTAKLRPNLKEKTSSNESINK